MTLTDAPSTLVGVDISVDLVRRLVLGQFPRWADLPITPVDRQGNDNRTFRLGDELAVRLPSAERYVAGIVKEDSVLPLLADHLSLPVPVPVATGRPAGEFPHPWSIRRWIAGDTPDRDQRLNRKALARDLGAVLGELHAVPSHDGPWAGRHSFFRGCHPGVYGDQVQEALARLGDEVDREACAAAWADAVRSAWSAPPVWVHGDVAVGNLLSRQGRLAAVIDFGTCAVGDPACDLVMAWTFFDIEERRVFRESVDLPEDAWERARGWALWKALITLVDGAGADREAQARTLRQVLEDAGTGRPALPRPAG